MPQNLIIGTLTTMLSNGHHIPGEIILICTKIKDSNQLYQAVAEIGDWVGLCSNLGVNEAKMNELQHSSGDNEKKKRECLQAYFDTGRAYWEEVVRAISNHPISNKRLASKIVEKYQSLLAVDKSHNTFVCS